MMFIDDNGYIEYNMKEVGYIEYNMKEVQKTYMPTRAELIMNERPFYNRYLNSRKKKHGRN